MPGPLDGLVVVDASWGMPGAVATMVLADYGATVIRIERPGGGRDRDAVTRHVWQRGKHSVELDVTDAADRERLLEAVARSDVFIESFGPARAAELGFGHEVVSARAPGVVHCSISAYGQTGPLADRPGWDALVAARLGLMAEQAGSRPGPTFLGHPTISYGTGFLAVISVLAAVHVRRTTGEGQHLDVSMLDAVLAQSPMNWWWHEGGRSYLAREGTDEGFGRSRIVTDLFECGDGEYIMVHTGGQGGFKRAMDLLGLGEHVRTIVDEVEMSVPLDDEEYRIARTVVPEAFKSRPRAEWLEMFHAADLAALPVLRPGEVLLDEQVLNAGVVHEVRDEGRGVLRTVGPVIKLSASPAPVPPPAPAVGRDTSRLEQLVGVSPPGTTTADPGDSGSAGPLAGVTVVDFSSFFATAYGAKFLADLGADVIKVEPLVGDQMRPLPEPFEASNRGKRSIALDLKSGEGRRIAVELARNADVVMHNFRPGKAESAGIGYEQLKAVNPRLIYCYLPGYGSTGPKAHLKSFAPLLSGFTGLFYEGAGEGNPPIRRVMGNEDYYNGFLGAVSAMLGLEHRARTGEGQYIEMPQLHSSLLVTSENCVDEAGALVTDVILDAEQTGFGPLYRLYRTDDHWICIACVGAAAFQRLRDALGLTDLPDDLDYDAAVDPERAARVVEGALERRLKELSAEAAFALLDGAGVPCEIPLPDPYIPEFLWEEWAYDDQRVFEHYHPSYGWIREIGTVLRMSRTPCVDRGPAALLGQHTAEILSELGYGEAEITQLVAGRVCLDGALSTDGDTA